MNPKYSQSPSTHTCILLSCVFSISVLDGATGRDLRERREAKSCQRTVVSVLTAALFLSCEGDRMQLQEVRKKQGAGEDNIQSEGQFCAQLYTLLETRPSSPGLVLPAAWILLSFPLSSARVTVPAVRNWTGQQMQWDFKLKASLHVEQKLGWRSVFLSSSVLV